jgi:hypothetical protein
MSYARTELLVNADTRQLIKSTTQITPVVSGDRPKFVYADTMILAVHFVDNAGSDYVLNAGDTFDCGLDDDFEHKIDQGTASAGYSGAVTSIDVTGLTLQSIIPSTGHIVLVNGAGDSDRVAYTAFDGVDTFTVSATLSNTYLLGDVVRVEDDLMAYSDDTQVDIAGDWADIDRATGKISIRINNLTDSFFRKIDEADTNGQLLTWLQIRRVPNGETAYSTMLQDWCYSYESVIGSLGSPGTSFVQYLTQTQGDARYLKIGEGVLGPGSSTDNAIMRWNGTAGSDAQNSLVTIDDTGIITTPAAGTITAATSLLLNSPLVTMPEGSDLQGMSIISLDATPTDLPSEAAGQVYFNATDYTLNIVTGLGPVLQVNQEDVIIVYNGTGAQLDNGTVCYAIGAVGENPSVTKAGAGTHDTCPEELVILTMDIPNGQMGIAIEFRGKIRGLNTDAFNLGDTIYLDDTVPPTGLVTNTRPTFPSYARSLGGVVVKDASAGVIQARITGKPIDTIIDSYDGSFRETITFTVSSNGTVVTGSLVDSDGLGNLTMVFSDGLTTLDVSPAATIALTAGTDAAPQTNYVYIPQSTKVLTVATSDWPTTVEHIRVAQVEVRSAATTQIDGVLGNQNWNDHMKTTGDNGHLLHIAEAIRIKTQAKWWAGAEGTATVVGGSNIYISTTAGTVYQLHRQVVPLLDMTQYTIDAVSTGSKTFTISDDGDLSSTFPDGRMMQVNGSTGNDGIYTVASTSWSSPNFIITVSETPASAVADGTIGDDIHIINDSVTAYKNLIDLGLQTTDASGGALNNTSYSVVVWGVANKTGEPSHLMANMPTDTYSKTAPDSAVTDALGYSVYDIPTKFNGTGFLIWRYTFVNNGGTISLYDSEDLRGKTPNTTAGGGGGGGGGATTFLGLTDTPGSYAADAVIGANAGATALENKAFTMSATTLTGPAATVISAATSVTITGGSASSVFNSTGLQVAGTLNMSSVFPVIKLNETDAATDEKNWQYEANLGVYKLRAVNDAETAGTTAMQFERSSQTITGVIFPTGNFLVGQTTQTASEKFGLTGDAYITGALTTTGAVTIGAFTLPATDGAANQVLVTNGSGTVTWTSVAGTGDVVGPSSSTDNAIARFDSTTGKLLQNSLVTVSDTGAITVASEFTLPVVDGTANQVLTTDGAGAVTWEDAGASRSSVTKTANYTATGSDDIIYCDTNTFTITLPAAASNTNLVLTIKNRGTGIITVDGNASETIDGALTQALTTKTTLVIHCDGSNWNII